MPRCKPGDLAVIIRADIPEWIGVLVTVIERDEKWSAAQRCVVWAVRPHCSVGKRVVSGCRTLSLWRGETPFVAARDNDLRPIRPGELEDDVPRDEVIEA